ncbi:SDR family oxidoreductase [Algivirga pacifica]|uniref:SDR family oxidoreductase n=1 Tax=Algivirga pacifica TaxID=1162670 RepID=A0ABP9D5I5_9BACT
MKNKKVFVVTGGSGVLGMEICRHLCKQGHDVALLSKDEEKLKEAVVQLKEITNGKVMGVTANVLDKYSLLQAKALIDEELGSCEVLINAAGGNHPDGTAATPYLQEEDLDSEVKTFYDMTTEGLRFVSDLNFLGTLLPVQVFTKDMIGVEGCSVLNVSSMSAFSPLTKIPAYSAAKASINNFTQWLAVYLSRVNIRVNAIAPGFFLTDQNRTLLTNQEGGLTDRGEQIIAHTPMQRFGRPEDLIGVVDWLCGDQAAFVTGVVVPVDGGFSAYSGV